jgi:hypothetical protein
MAGGLLPTGGGSSAAASFLSDVEEQWGIAPPDRPGGGLAAPKCILIFFIFLVCLLCV